MADVRADCVPSEVEVVWSDGGEEFNDGEYSNVCRKFGIRQDFTTAKSPGFNGVEERSLDIIEKAALVARVQAPSRGSGFHRRRGCRRRRCTGSQMPSITPPPLPTRTTNHRTRCDMVQLLRLSVMPFFVQETAVGTARQGLFPDPRVAFTSGQILITRETRCGCSRGPTRW